MIEELFIENKYFKWYFEIIENAKTKIYDVYSEIHHIIPKCMGGNNDDSNLVRLNYREHFICHLLLPKFCKHKKHKLKMIHSLIFMLGINSECENKKIYTSWQYNHVKKIAKNNLVGENNSFYGKKHNEESRRKMSEAQRKRKRKYKHTDESKRKLSIKAKNRSNETKLKIKLSKQKYFSENNVKWYTNGTDSIMLKENDNIPDGFYPGRTKFTDEARKNISNAVQGEKNPFYGKKHSKETIEKIHTPESKIKRSRTQTGRISYNNGIKEIRIKKDEIPPKGFIIGRLKRKK